MIGIMIILALILFVLMGISDDLVRIAKALEKLREEKKDDAPWTKTLEYCENDVIATEEVFNLTKDDSVIRDDGRSDNNESNN